MSDRTYLDRALGIALVSAAGTRARACFAVTDVVRQPSGIVHGGAYAACAEMVATAGTDRARGALGQAVGMANHTSFLRPVTEGTVTAEARAVHTVTSDTAQRRPPPPRRGREQMSFLRGSGRYSHDDDART